MTAVETIRALIDDGATRSPDAAALLTSTGEEISYSTLARRGAALRDTLAAEGVKPGRAVVVVAPNGPEAAIAFLGVASYTVCAPVNPELSRPDLEFVIDDIDAAAVVVGSGMERCTEIAARRGLPVIDLAALSDDPTGAPPPPPPTAPQPGDVALVLHTSGTTARPKQVALTNGNLMASATNVVDALDLRASDRCLNVMPLFHIHGLVAALLASLRAGGSAVCTPGLDPTQFLSWARELDATWYTAVPTMHHAVLAAARADRAATQDLRLRFARSSSAALPPTVGADLEEVLGIPVIEAYGMTEAAHQIASNPLPPATRKPGTVGRPAGCDVAILDDEGRELPPGATGEIAIRGPNVTAGYVGNPDANEAAFTNGWMRTGDEGQIDDDGYLALTGRLKELINRGGEKISPREIDEVVLCHPDVEQALTFALPHPTLGEDVAVAIVVGPGAAMSDADLRSFAAERLSPYKVPHTVVRLDELPKGPTGKLQRIGLAERLGLGGSPTPDDEEPTRSPVEAAVANLWRETLSRDAIGLDDDFIALGGDSLSALSLLAAITTVFDVELTVRDVFDNSPTVRRMATTITARRAEPGRDSTDVASRPARDDRPAERLSLAQESEWFVSAFAPDAPVGNVTLALRITGRLDHDRLRDAFTQLIERQQTLRARFAPRDGRPEVEIVPVDSTPFTVHEQMSEARILAAAEAVASKPFDLRIAPLLRAHLFPIDETPDGHVLLVVCHHIVADGWSRGIIRNELAALYDGNALPPLTANYFDIAEEERWKLSSDRARAHVRWWATHLDPLPDALALPGDRARPARLDPRSAIVTRTMGPDLRADVTALSSDAGATLFMTLLAGFEALVARHTGRDDFLLGVPTNGRHRSDAHGLVGLFADVLPMRARVDVDITFRDLLARVRAECLDVFEHQQVPVQAIINEIHPPRAANQVGLVQVLFQLRNLPAVVDAFGGARLETLDVSAGALAAELEVDVVDDGHCLSIRCQHSRAVFDTESIERLLERFEWLLRDAARCPDTTVGQLAVLPPGERDILDRFGSGPPLKVPSVTIPELVARRTAACAEATAIRADGVEVTYGELERLIRELDYWLRERGVRRGASVGLALRRDPALVATIQALWRIGAMVVPIDPAWPSTRIAMIVDDADVEFVLTNRENAAAFADLSVITIEEATECSVGGASDLPTESDAMLDATPDDSAYIEFTSGSTGRPKAVEVSHRSLASYCAAHQDLTGLDDHDIVLASTPLTFDPAIDELVLPLTAGAQIMIADDRAYADPAAVATLIDTGLPTVLGPTPSFLAALLAVGWQARDTLAIWVGGEVLPPQLAAGVLPRCGRLLNTYGPTETTVWATGYDVTEIDVGRGTSIPIGGPLPDGRFIVVDALGEPSPIGVPGELLIAGDRVAIGYRNQPEQTATAFIERDDPFDGRCRRWYRTGDVVRWRSDGALEFVGRNDGQLKVRGVRIEPGEVEAAVGTHPAVQSAAAVMRGDQLTCFFTSAGSPPSAAELRRHVATLVPPAVVPSRFVPVDAMPLTSSGKIDRRSLPSTVSDESGRGRRPWSPTERVLVRLWQQILELDQVSADDEFFEIGGHSLLVIQLFAAIEERFGWQLPLSQIFVTPTLAELATAIDDASNLQYTRRLLVPLREGAASSVALFLVPGAGGTALAFQHAVSRMRSDSPIFGVEFWRVGSMSIEDQAALVLPEILDAAADQPFIVGGYSFGGKVAFEIARQAAQVGAQCHLVIVDTPAPTPGAVGRAWRAARKNAARLQRRLRRRPNAAPEPLTASTDAALSPEQRWQTVIKAQRNANVRISKRYQPPRDYSAGAVVVASRASIRQSGDRTLWWRRYIHGRIEVRNISLDHDRLDSLEVQDEVAVILDAHLESVRSNTSPN